MVHLSNEQRIRLIENNGGHLPQINGHFFTYASMWPTLALLYTDIIHKLFHAWKLEHSKGDFLLVELSGGNGNFANCILSALKEYSKTDESYSQMRRRFKHEIIEISSKLVAQQAELLAPFIASGKLTITQSSALDLDVHKKIAVCISNELFDSLPFDMVRFNSHLGIWEGASKILVANKKSPRKLDEYFPESPDLTRALMSEAEKECQDCGLDLSFLKPEDCVISVKILTMLWDKLAQRVEEHTLDISKAVQIIQELFSIELNVFKFIEI
jgi:SAM-dependent MidA family methyltransferase